MSSNQRTKWELIKLSVNPSGPVTKCYLLVTLGYGHFIFQKLLNSYDFLSHLKLHFPLSGITRFYNIPAQFPEICYSHIYEFGHVGTLSDYLIKTTPRSIILSLVTWNGHVTFIQTLIALWRW